MKNRAFLIEKQGVFSILNRTHFYYIKGENKRKGVLKMKRYHGEEVVKRGIYLSLKRSDLVTIENERGLLPGESNDSYVRIPPLVMIVLGPLMGLIYVIFLPFISFAMVVGLMANKVWLGVRWIGESLLGVASVNWRPGVAYLTWLKQSKKGKKPQFQEEPKEEKKPMAPDLISELEKEIAEKREEESEG